jgi:hypothetical protein
MQICSIAIISISYFSSGANFVHDDSMDICRYEALFRLNNVINYNGTQIIYVLTQVTKLRFLTLSYAYIDKIWTSLNAF